MRINVKLYLPIQQPPKSPAISHIIQLHKTINLPTRKQPHQIPQKDLWDYITTAFAKFKPIVLISFNYQIRSGAITVTNCTVQCEPQPYIKILNILSKPNSNPIRRKKWR